MLPARFAWLACVPLIIVTTAASPAAKPLSAAPSAARRVGFRLCFVDLERATSKVGSIQCSDRFIGLTGIGHLDKSEAAGAASFAVGNNADAFDRAMRLKQSAKLWFGGGVGQVANIQVLHNCALSISKQTFSGGWRPAASVPAGKSCRPYAFSFELVCSAGATRFFSAKAFNIFCVLCRRLIFCRRLRLNRALSPLIPDIFISCLKR